VLSHHLGNLTAQVFIDIENIGGASVTIRYLDFLIMDDRDAWQLPVRTYYSRLQQLNPSFQEIPFFPISLKPGEHWAEQVRSYADWTESQEREAGSITTAIQTDITEKLKRPHPDSAPDTATNFPVMPPRGKPFEPQEADAALVQKAIAFFQKNFWLDIGNYHLIVVAKSDSNSALLVKGFSFLILESQRNTLRSFADDYKYGFGNVPAGVWVRLKPIDDDEARKKYSRGERLVASL
jgi:hypothetical protein